MNTNPMPDAPASRGVTLTTEQSRAVRAVRAGERVAVPMAVEPQPRRMIDHAGNPIGPWHWCPTAERDAVDDFAVSWWGDCSLLLPHYGPRVGDVLAAREPWRASTDAIGMNSYSVAIAYEAGPKVHQWFNVPEDEHRVRKAEFGMYVDGRDLTWQSAASMPDWAIRTHVRVVTAPTRAELRDGVWVWPDVEVELHEAAEAGRSEA